MTSSFGRGTDFSSLNESDGYEGMHVIQAFLSMNNSEETQIQGRTARQGAKGSYKLMVR